MGHFYCRRFPGHSGLLLISKNNENNILSSFRDQIQMPYTAGGHLSSRQESEAILVKAGMLRVPKILPNFV